METSFRLDRLSDIAKEVQALYPDPNTPGSLSNGDVGGQGIFRNYVRQQDRKFDRNNYDFKVNYNLSASSQIWGKYSRMGATVDSPQAYLGYDGSLVGDTTVQMYTFGDTWTISPTMVFDATLGISKMNHNSQESDLALGNFGLETLGIPGMNGGKTSAATRAMAASPSSSWAAAGATSTSSATPTAGTRWNAMSALTRLPAT